MQLMARLVRTRALAGAAAVCSRPSSSRGARASAPVRASLAVKVSTACLLLLMGCARSAAPPAAGVRPSIPANRVSIAVEQDFGMIYGRGACSQEAQLTGDSPAFAPMEHNITATLSPRTAAIPRG